MDGKQQVHIIANDKSRIIRVWRRKDPEESWWMIEKLMIREDRAQEVTAVRIALSPQEIERLYHLAMGNASELKS